MRQNGWFATTAAVCCVLAVAVSSAADGQPSLPELQAAARKNAFGVREAWAVVAQREREADEAWHRLLPTISAQGSYHLNQYQVEAPMPAPAMAEPVNATFTARNQWDFELNGKLPLVDVSRWFAIDAASKGAQAERAQVHATENSVEQSLVKTYFEALGAEAVVRAAGGSYAAARENLAYLETQLKAGVVSELDVQRVRAELVRVEQVTAQAEYTRATLVRSLETQTGLKISPPYLALEPDDLHAEAPLETWLSTADSTHAVTASRLRIVALEGQAAQQRAGLIPALQLEASERVTNAPGFGKSPYYSVGVVAKWNLDLATYTGARALDAAATASRVRAARQMAETRDAIHDAWQHVIALIAKCKTTRIDLQVAQEFSALTARQYAAGTTALLTLVQARRDTLSAEVAALQADADLEAARALLRLSSGHAASVKGP